MRETFPSYPPATAYHTFLVTQPTAILPVSGVTVEHFPHAREGCFILYLCGSDSSLACKAYSQP